MTEMPWEFPSKRSKQVYGWAIKKVVIHVSENNSDVQ